MNWAELFLPGGSLLEVVVRGTVLFLALFLLLRLMPRRQLGSLGVSDLLVIVLIADAAQNGLAGEYRSITEGVVLVATILFWNWAIDALDYWFPAWHLNASSPRVLVSEGRVVHRNMEKEGLTQDELMSQLRQHGVEELQSVRRAYVESDGRISVIRSHGRVPRGKSA